MMTDSILLQIICWTVLGLLTGSFLNVCRYRIPRSLSIVWPGSQCPGCSTRLVWFELIPLIGYWLNRGRCRYCERPIGVNYPLVEAAMALLGAFVGWRGETWEQSLALFLLSAFLLLIALIDYDWQMIYDRVAICFALCGIALWPLGGEGIQQLLVLHGAAAGIGFAVLLLIALVSRGGMGFGDVKFAAAAGLWLNWPQMLLMLFSAFVVGGVSCLLLLFLRLKRRKDLIPFGPFLTFGVWLAYVYGDRMIDWYWQAFL